MVCFRVPSNNPGSLNPDSRDPETETGNLESEKRVHRIHGTLETGLHNYPSQPGGPLKGAGGLFALELTFVALLSGCWHLSANYWFVSLLPRNYYYSVSFA